jgi:hypothetical protein
MSWFARTNDTVLNVTSTYPLLTPYAVRHASGSISVLALNKHSTSNLTGQILLNGFTPGANAMVRAYGLAQDEATRTNAAYALQDIATNSFAGAGTNFTYSFPPYSLTLLTLVPAAPQVAVLPSAPGQFSLQVQGQPSVRYVVQSSTNFINWIPVATNTLTGSTLNVTNALGTPWKFWRAVWLP